MQGATHILVSASLMALAAKLLSRQHFPGLPVSAVSAVSAAGSAVSAAGRAGRAGAEYRAAGYRREALAVPLPFPCTSCLHAHCTANRTPSLTLYCTAPCRWAARLPLPLPLPLRSLLGAIAAFVFEAVAFLRAGGKHRRVFLYLCLNLAYMSVEFVYGYLNNSIGLLGDACHMLFDSTSIVFGLYAVLVRNHPKRRIERTTERITERTIERNNYLPNG